MPNFNPETLHAVKELYIQHLGYIPPLIENADVEITLLKQETFLSASSFFKPRNSSISHTFAVFLRSVGSRIELFTDEEYCTPAHLVLKEFLVGIRLINIENPLQEIADIETRLALYRALFLSAENLMKIDLADISQFKVGLVNCQNQMTLAKQNLDIFDVEPLLNDLAKNLRSAFENFHAQYNPSYDNPLALHLHNSLNKEVQLLTSSFTKLSQVFAHTRSEGVLFEQQRQEMRVYSEFITDQIDRVKQGMQAIFKEAESMPQILINAQKTKDIDAQITCLFTRIFIGIESIKWQVGTEAGRSYGIKQRSGVRGCWGLDSHQPQNLLTEDDKTVAEEEGLTPSCS